GAELVRGEDVGALEGDVLTGAKRLGLYARREFLEDGAAAERQEQQQCGGAPGQRPGGGRRTAAARGAPGTTGTTGGASARRVGVFRERARGKRAMVHGRFRKQGVGGGGSRSARRIVGGLHRAGCDGRRLRVAPSRRDPGRHAQPRKAAVPATISERSTSRTKTSR